MYSYRSYGRYGRLLVSHFYPIVEHLHRFPSDSIANTRLLVIDLRYAHPFYGVGIIHSPSSSSLLLFLSYRSPVQCTIVLRYLDIDLDSSQKLIYLTHQLSGLIGFVLSRRALQSK